MPTSLSTLFCHYLKMVNFILNLTTSHKILCMHIQSYFYSKRWLFKFLDESLKVSDVIPPWYEMLKSVERSLRDAWKGSSKFRESYIDNLVKDFIYESLSAIVSSTIMVRNLFFKKKLRNRDILNEWSSWRKKSQTTEKREESKVGLSWISKLTLMTSLRKFAGKFCGTQPGWNQNDISFILKLIMSFFQSRKLTRKESDALEDNYGRQKTDLNMRNVLRENYMKPLTAEVGQPLVHYR